MRRFAHAVSEIENQWIPMPDGVRLAARIWLPEDALTHPVPAVLEFIPYRKRDFTAVGDALHHPYLAGHGYAAVRCDLRGNGDSEGIFDDEYSPQELDDGYHIVEWLARQPWCSGKVGMMGISWGGFNCLQVAALRPPSLRAIYSVCSTDDRYADDVHYMGGCLLNENIQWGTTMTSFAMRPPDPAIVGAAWRDMWMQRLERLPNLVASWMRHQRRDAFWKHGSICEDYPAIEAAVYLVGGWADGYTNAIPRMVAGLKCPTRALIGPWTHAYPWKANPAPAINGLKDLVRWWDHWLKGIDSGLMQEPKLRAWMQESVPPSTFYKERPGRWVAEDRWPSSRIEPVTYHLNAPGTLDARARRGSAMEVCSEQLTGQSHGDWCPYGYEAETPSDQREEDGRSLCFETGPLGRDMEILGAPSLELELGSDRTNASIYVRLCDVAPGGASTRVTYGVLNLTHRDGHESPAPLAPGERYRIRLQLNDTAHRFPRGHRIRIGISTVGWPLIWTSPEVVTLTVLTGVSTLQLPVRPRQATDRGLPSLGKPETAAPLAVTERRPYRRRRKLYRDFVSGETVVEMVKDRGHHRLEDIGLSFSGRGEETYRIVEGDPLSARAEVTYTIELRRDADYDIEVSTRFVLTSTAKDFLLTTEANAYERGQRVFAKTWSESISRDLV